MLWPLPWWVVLSLRPWPGLAMAMAMAMTIVSGVIAMAMVRCVIAMAMAFEGGVMAIHDYGSFSGGLCHFLSLALMGVVMAMAMVSGVITMAMVLPRATKNNRGRTKRLC